VASNTALRSGRESLKLHSEGRALSISCISLQQAQAQEGALSHLPRRPTHGRGHGAALGAASRRDQFPCATCTTIRQMRSASTMRLLSSTADTT
jgi:hypothetical protein